MSSEFETVEVDFEVKESAREQLEKDIEDLEPHQKRAFAELSLLQSKYDSIKIGGDT